MPTPSWPPEQTAAFKAMVQAGRSKEELAAKFGISVSSVRARINRMGAAAMTPRPKPESGPVRILQTQGFHCRFPIGPEDQPGTADMLVCGKAVVPGRSWCPHCLGTVMQRTGSKMIDIIDRSPTAWGSRFPSIAN